MRETLRARELMERERKRERRVVCHRRMDGVAQPNGWVDGPAISAEISPGSVSRTTPKMKKKKKASKERDANTDKCSTRKPNPRHKAPKPSQRGARNTVPYTPQTAQI